MQNSLLNEALRPAGATLGSYRGTEMALALPDSDGRAFTQGAALCDWSWRARLSVRGPETRKWLNGVVSANLRDLQPGHASPSFLLNPKGHILGLFDALALAQDAFLLLTDQRQIATLAETLRRFVFIAKVTLTDESETGGSLALAGPRAEAILSAVGIVPPAEVGNFHHTIWKDKHPLQIARWRLGGIETFELLLGKAEMVEAWQALCAAGATVIDATTQERQRILSGTALYGHDIRESDLPQETGLMQAVGHNKGCYIGQEIVERIRARGAVHRQFRGFLFSGAIAPGTRISAEGKEVGEATSVIERDGQSLALGYIRSEAATGPLRAGEAEGRSVALPFAEEGPLADRV